MQAIILAAGHGTRMLPLTETMSKCMVPVANRPLLDWTVEELSFCDEIIIIANKTQKDIINHFQNKVKIVFQEEQKGTGHALLQTEQHLKDDFLVVNGDNFYGKGNIKEFAQSSPISIACHKIEGRPQDHGIVEVSNGTVKSFEEKPDTPKSDLGNAGLYRFNKSVIDILKSIKPSPRGEYEIIDIIKHMISKNENVNAVQIETWFPLSYPWNILDANHYILEKEGSKIHPKAEIRPGAVIEEPVAIDEGAIIGPNCFIRKYSSIGKNCKVGQSVEIKNSIVMDNSFVSHISYVGDSVVGRNCNIAAGTFFANLRLDEKTIKVQVNGNRFDTHRRKLGAIVGDNVKFGVNVTVMPGKRIWPNLHIPPCMKIDEDVKEQLPLGKYSE